VSNHEANRVIFAIIALLSLAGVAVSAISLQRHYAKSSTGFCDLNEKFNCDIVNRSEYSAIADIPVAGIGVAGYLALFVLSTFQNSRDETPNRLLGLALAGFAFAVYLTYVEAYKLMTWCILCLTSQFLIFLISVCALAVKFRSRSAE
jgi:uncharacterized membrane protein